MVSRRGKPRIKKPEVIHLLESGTVDGLREAKSITQKLLNFHWNYYSELARQRNLIQEQIQEALIQTCIPFEAINW